jgi:low affinity Fe/Cu permease
MARWFTHFASNAARAAGHYLAFVIAVAVILVWAITGPAFGFSDTWQLVINTGTTIVTFLMVFLIQHTQNRDALAVHLKLDELIHAIEAADDEIIETEDQTDEQMAALKLKYDALAKDHVSLKERLGEVGSRAGGPNGQTG